MLHPPWTVASRAAAGWTASFAAVFLPALPESYVSSESYRRLLGTRPAQGYAAALLGCQPALTPHACLDQQQCKRRNSQETWRESFIGRSIYRCSQRRLQWSWSLQRRRRGSPAGNSAPPSRAANAASCSAHQRRATRQRKSRPTASHFQSAPSTSWFVSPSPTLLPVAAVFDESAWPAEAGMRTWSHACSWPAVAGGRRAGIPARRPRARVSSAMHLGLDTRSTRLGEEVNCQKTRISFFKFTAHTSAVHTKSYA
jgi:hypothetical protein